jgi:hypothetical protein
MKNRFLYLAVIMTAVFCGAMIFCSSAGYAQYIKFGDNIDPFADGSQYAYGENIGWLNFQPAVYPNVIVDDYSVTGYAWAENVGWINLSPTQYGGVVNDGFGNLIGYAWGENVGWINFQPSYGLITISSDESFPSGVSIGPDGNFYGWAWGENIGWIHFGSSSPVAYKVQTAWTWGPQTLIELAYFTAIPGAKSVILTWGTEAETDNTGFNLYRAESEQGEYKQINTSLIPAKGSPVQGARYEFLDTMVKNRKTYYYKLEDIDLSDTSTMHGPISATPRWIYGLGK